MPRTRTREPDRRRRRATEIGSKAPGTVLRGFMEFSRRMRQCALFNSLAPRSKAQVLRGFHRPRGVRPAEGGSCMKRSVTTTSEPDRSRPPACLRFSWRPPPARQRVRAVPDSGFALGAPRRRLDQDGDGLFEDLEVRLDKLPDDSKVDVLVDLSSAASASRVVSSPQRRRRLLDQPALRRSSTASPRR